MLYFALNMHRTLGKRKHTPPCSSEELFSSREKLYTPHTPLSPIFWAEGICKGRGCVYISEVPRDRICTCLPFLIRPPTSRRVFSPGVLRSKDFFDPIFVVFRDFCKSYFWHPYFYRFLGIFGDFGDFW